MDKQIVLYDARGVCKGYALVSAWPQRWDTEPPFAVFSQGVLYLRTDEWETSEDKRRWRVYRAAPQAQLVEL